MCERTEDDIIARRCALLRRKLRKRPCAPLDCTGSAALSTDELASGIRLPLFSCPFQGCTFHTDDRALFLHHVAGGVSDETHVQVLRETCGTCEDIPGMTPLEYVSGAVAIAERERWPTLGLSITRRCLIALCLRYNDAQVQCQCCFVCSQLRTSVAGYDMVDLKRPASECGGRSAEIQPRRLQDLLHIESECPGVLLNNASYSL